jgi:hypothetical protein
VCPFMGLRLCASSSPKVERHLDIRIARRAARAIDGTKDAILSSVCEA